jgi:hypothetical protein
MGVRTMPEMASDPMINSTVALRLSTRATLQRIASESGQSFTSVVRDACDLHALKWLEAQQNKASA